MTTDENVYDLLEHFGVKGMHWGVRSAKNGSLKKQPKTDAEIKERRKKIAIIGASGAIIAGAVATGVILHKNKNTQIASISKQQSSFGASQRLFNAALNIKMDKLGKTAFSAEKGSKAREAAFREMNHADANHKHRMLKLKNEHKNWVDDFKAKQTLLNRSANKQLKEWDNVLDVPIHMRGYLTDWD